MLVVVLRGPEAPKPPPAPPPTAPAPQPPPERPPLSLGLTEANPHLVAPGPQPEAFAAWRDRLVALKPRYLRVLVDWRRVQPSPLAPPDWTQPADGCLRGLPPCEPFNGIRDVLRAARDARLIPVIVLLNTPDWAASPPEGCREKAGGPQATLPADLEAYRVLVRSLLELGRAERVALPWWAPWNEPNHPTFLGPQRAECDPSSPTLAADRYAVLAREMKAELDAAPGEQHILLGETAGYFAPRAVATGAAEFARALPRDVVCAAGAWGEHAYVKVEGELAGDSARDPVSAQLIADVAAALDAHGCAAELPIWITETGADPDDGRAGCEAMATALAGWARDPRVDTAFQYTFREDTAFRTGLADEHLRDARPAYAAWLAYAQGGLDAVADPAAACSAAAR